MSDPYLGEIRMFAGNYAPLGWVFCDGQLYPIAQNESLFMLIGTTYGGDGQETFAVPNLESRVPLHVSTTPSIPLGEAAGVEEVTLTVNQAPTHNHALIASEATADSTAPAGNLPAEAAKRFYLTPGATTAMSSSAIGPTGGSQPHENMQPYLVVNFIISMSGRFPSQT